MSTSNTKVWGIITIISLVFGIMGTVFGISASTKQNTLVYWSNFNENGYIISSTGWTTGTNLYVNFTLGTNEHAYAIYTGQVNISVNGIGADDGIIIYWCLNNQTKTENCPSVVVSAADEGNPAYYISSVVLQWYITEPPGSYNLTIRVKGLTTSTVRLTENAIFVAPCLPFF